MRVLRVSSFVLGLVLFAGVPALAQSDESHWGVTGSFVPRWKVPTQLGDLFDAQELDVTGSEFRIGFVRGRMRSGDWGVSFVHKPWKDGSLVRASDEDGAGVSDFYITRSVSMTGVEIHKFVPFVTFRQGTQIGMTFAGGVARLKGEVESHEYETSFSFDPVTRQSIVTRREVISMKSIKEDAGIEVLPLASIEAAVAVPLGRALKLRAGGGLNFPGYQIASVTITYLFGAR